MHKYSEIAWSIANIYSRFLASETRDLAAHIDKALAADRAEIERQRVRAAKVRLPRKSRGTCRNARAPNEPPR